MLLSPSRGFLPKSKAMQAQRAPLFALALALIPAGCGERTPNKGGVGGSTTPPYIRAEAGDPTARDRTPVRIGELGPAFAACNARGAVRERAGGGPVPVRAAPFEPAAEIDRLGMGASFFICSRSLDQRWFGIVYDTDGDAAERCGVSAPVSRGRDYAGPCRAGWVPSARVRLVSGAPQQLPVERNSL